MRGSEDGGEPPKSGLTGASNGPTEAMNLLVKKIKRCGHGFKSFRNYPLRVLLHCGGIKWGGCRTNQDSCIFMRQWFQAAYLTRACVTGTHEHMFPKGMRQPLGRSSCYDNASTLAPVDRVEPVKPRRPRVRVASSIL